MAGDKEVVRDSIIVKNKRIFLSGVGMTMTMSDNAHEFTTFI
jgi:hypothetical protein